MESIEVLIDTLCVFKEIQRMSVVGQYTIYATHNIKNVNLNGGKRHGAMLQFRRPEGVAFFFSIQATNSLHGPILASNGPFRPPFSWRG